MNSNHWLLVWSGQSGRAAGRRSIVLPPATRTDGPLSVTRRLARLLVRPYSSHCCHRH